jgi:hypothetical protein
MAVASIDDFLSWEFGSIRYTFVCQGCSFPTDWHKCFADYKVNGPNDLNSVGGMVYVAPEQRRDHSAFIIPPKSVRASCRAFPIAFGGLRVDHYDVSGVLWLQSGSRHVGHFLIYDDPMSFARAILIVAVQNLPLHNRLIVHGSGVVIDDRCWVFIGRSGAGKTTISTELRGRGRPFSVDRTVLEVQDSRVVAYPTPFSDHNGMTENLGPFPVAGLVFIEQSLEHEVVRLDALQAAKQLLNNIPVYVRSREFDNAVLGLANSICSKSTCLSMKFRKDSGFWQKLEGSISR